MNATPITNINSIKIGSKVRCGKVIMTITGTDKHGFIAEQEYKGQKHSMTIPLSSFNNPHLIQMFPA